MKTAFKINKNNNRSSIVFTVLFITLTLLKVLEIINISWILILLISCVEYLMAGAIIAITCGISFTGFMIGVIYMFIDEKIISKWRRRN